MKYLKLFENFILEDSDEVQDEIQPEEDDAFIQSNGFKFSVSCGGKFLGDFVEQDDAEQAIINYLKKSGGNWFPSCWFVSDHGNISPLSLDF